METLNVKLQAKQYRTTCRTFRTADQIVRLNRPMTDLPALIGLQEANGLEMGLILSLITHAQTFVILLPVKCERSI
jgi:hypothetical protein